MKTSEALRQTDADALERFLHHAFFTEVEAGSLSQKARDTYFHYEHRFVQQAVIVMGHMLTKAPTAEARQHIGAILRGLVTEQLPAFELIFDRIGPPPSTLPAEVIAFCDGMTALVKNGTYAQGLTTMLAAEWSYGQISRRLVSGGIQDALLFDWFDLHVQPTFTAGIDWIEDELERTVPNTFSDEDRFAALSETFLCALRLEIDFHSQLLKAK